MATIHPIALESPAPLALTGVECNSALYTLIVEQQKADTPKHKIVSIVDGTPAGWIK